MTKAYIALILLVSGSILISCESPSTNEENTEMTSEESAEVDEKEMEMPSEASFKFDLIIANNIAAPVKLLTDMNKVGLTDYQDGITNPTDKISNYVTAEEKAMSFGVYGADLSYKSLYNKNEDMANYLIAIRNLSEDLGLTQLFDAQAIETFERIKTNPDSVKLFIFDKYDQADEYLRSNDRLLTASLILTGGLVESLHLVSSQIENTDASKDAYMIFLEQKNTLKSLISLYETLEADGKEIPVKADVEMLYKKFQEVESYEMFSKENMKGLHESVDQVRNKMV